MKDEFQRNIEAFKALGQSIDFWDTLLIHLVSSKLDTATRRAWKTEMSKMLDFF